METKVAAYQSLPRDAKLSGTVEDIDLSLEDFTARVNSDLVGKVVNIASRCAGFMAKKFDNRLSAACAETPLVQEFIAAGESIALHYENRDFGRAVREIMALADKANQYIDEKKPWALAKMAGREQEVHEVCSVGLNLFRQLLVYLAPILPEMAEAGRDFLNVQSLGWESRQQLLLGHTINAFTPLMTRVEKEKVDAMVDASKENLAPANSIPSPPTGGEGQGEGLAAKKPVEQISPTVTIDDFLKIDMRVAKIVNAQHVPGADKLLQLTLDIGEEKLRNVFAGIKSAYPEPSMLIGRHTVMVANLAPRKMKFGMSEGMVLAAGPGGADIFILSPDDGATPGMQVK